MRRRKKESTNSFAAVAVVAAVIAVSGAVFVVNNRSNTPNGKPNGSNSPTVPEAGDGKPIVEPLPQTAKGNLGEGNKTGKDTKISSAVIYDVETDNDGFSRLKPVTVKIPPTAMTDAPVVALNALAERKDSALPPGSKVRSVEVSKWGTAFVDFSPEFTKNFPGGDENEALTLNAVSATLSQFDGIKHMQILVEGKKIDSLGGMQSLKAPLPVAPPGTAQTARKEGSGEP